MSLNTRTVQSAQQAQGLQAIQGFAMQNANDPDPSTVMSIVVDDAKAQIHRRKTDLEKFYQDQLVQSTEIEVLGTEKDQLLKVLLKLDPNAATKKWSVEDFQQAVKKTKREWENKDRFFGGKPQSFFHKIIGKFGAHSNLFKMVPQQTNYTSIVTGAATILMSASVQHADTIEELSRVLSTIDDEAAACTRDSEFHQSEFMQNAVAKFFIAVFLLLGDVAAWYQSSSWKKMRNSLHEGFKQQFEDALQNIIVLSKGVQRAASQGTNGEVRVVRLTVEELRLELKDIRIGQADMMRDMAQQQFGMLQQVLAQQKISQEQSKLNQEEIRNMISMSLSQLMRSKTFLQQIAANAVPLLQNEFVNAPHYSQNQIATASYHSSHADPPTGPLADLISHGVTHLPSMAARPGTFRINELLKWSESLLDYVQRGAGFQTLSNEETPVFFDHRIVIALDQWLQADESKLLYLESPSYVTAAAMRIVLSAGDTDPPMPCASFFCRAQEVDDEFDNESEVQTGVDPLLGVVYSLIYQILRVLPPLTEQTLITGKNRFTDLDSTLSSWDHALELLEDTLSLAPALMMIVIDGLLAFEDEHEYEMEELLGVFRKQMDVKEKLLKVLLTSDRMLFSITTKLASDEMELLKAGAQQRRGIIPLSSGRHGA